MTFRIDDLLIAVLPAGSPEGLDCADCSRDTALTQSPCSGNSDACNCLDCGCTDSFTLAPPPEKDARSWRDEQFALLACELDDALAR